jgi:hypothetical protein
LHQQLQHSPQPPLVSIILDGENAWEGFHNDAHDFFQQLYEALSANAKFRCVTVSEYLAAHPVAPGESLPDLHSGSWINADFATWIGHPEKNAAWAHLSRAREALAGTSRADGNGRKAWESLGVAEGSDWMWWFGDTHVTAQADEFDRLFRSHLANAYRFAKLPVPASLHSPVRQRGPESTHRPTGLLHATIDGKDSSYYEWLYAGRIDLSRQYAAIQRAGQCLRQVWYGFDDRALYIRLDYDAEALSRVSAWAIDLVLAPEVTIRLERNGAVTRAEFLPPSPLGPSSGKIACAVGSIVELAIPRGVLKASDPRMKLELRLLGDGQVLEQYPGQGAYELAASPAELEDDAWPV